MPKLWGSIDLGTHTARLLVAEITGPPAVLRPRVRKREYVHLGRGFEPSGRKTLGADAVARALKVMEEFRDTLQSLGVESVWGVATGVVREAANQDQLLTRVYEQTGIQIKPIGEDEEAHLTGEGALYALGMQRDAVLVFDLGGGSTEFYFRSEGEPLVASIPLGNVLLGQQYLKSDPPTSEQIQALSRRARRLLEEGLTGTVASAAGVRMIGTGGTVTAIAAMLSDVPAEQITEEKLNGVMINKKDLEGVISRLLSMSMAERLTIPSLDAGRAEVMPAGALIVKEIIDFYDVPEFITSMGDLLEGNLLRYLEGYRDE